MTRLLPTTANNDTMRRSVGVSATMHMMALLLLFFGLPHFMQPLPTPTVLVPMEVVDISELTNTRIKTPDELEEPKQQPTPPPPPKQEEQKVAPPPPPPPPPEQAKPEPAPPQPQPKPAEAVKPEAALPKPTEKPKPPEVAKPKPDMLASVLKNVEKMKQAPPPVKTLTPEKPLPKVQSTPQSAKAPALSDRLTISEEDAVRRQIEMHWNVPIGARDIHNMVVVVRIAVNQDRSVQSVEVVDKTRMATDSYFRAMAESVTRAIYASSPLELPEGKYEQWKVIESVFSAKDML